MNSQDMLCEVLDSMPEAFFALNNDNTFKLFNKKAEKYWGRNSKDLVGKNIWVEFPEAMSSNFYRCISNISEENVKEEGEFFSQIICKNIQFSATFTVNGILVYFKEPPEKEQTEALAKNAPEVSNQQNTQLTQRIVSKDFVPKTAVSNRSLYEKSYSTRGQSEDITGSWIEKLKEIFKKGEAQERVNSISKASGVAHFYSQNTDEKEKKDRVETENLAFLAEISDVFSRFSSAEEIMQTVAAKIGAYLNVNTCNFIEIDERQDKELKVCYSWAQADTPPLSGKLRIKDYLNEEFERACRIGETFVVENTQTDNRTDAAAYSELKMGAFVGVPFHHKGDWKFFLFITDSGPRKWYQDEIELFQELTYRTFLRLERAWYEEALQKSEEKYKTLFETIDVGLCICELIRNEEGNVVNYRFLELNAAVEKLTGLKRNIIAGRLATEIIPDVDEWWLGTYERVAVSKETIRFEHFWQSMGRWYDIKAFPYGLDQFAVLYNDITERKEAEQRLKDFNTLLEQQVEERTQAVADSKDFIEEIFLTTPDLITIHEAVSNNIIFANHDEYWKDIFNPDEFNLMSHEERPVLILQPEQTEKVKRFLEERQWIADREVKEMELKTKSGKWVRIRSKIFKRDNSGMASQFISFTTDITESKRTQEELFKNLNLLKQAEEIANGGSWEYEISSCKFNWSEGMYKLFNITPGTPVTPDLYFELATEQYKKTAEGVVKNIKTEFLPFEEVIELKIAENKKILKVKGTVIHDGYGKPIRVLGVDMDATISLKAEAKVRESEKQLSKVLDSLPQIAWTVSRDNEITYFNNRYFEYTGLTFEESIYSGWLKLIHPDFQKSLIEKWKNCFNNSSDFNAQYLLKNREGEYHWHLMQIVAVENESGEAYLWIGTSTDIHERVIADQKLKEQELLQQQQKLNIVLEAEERERKRISEGLHNGVGQLLYATSMFLHQLKVENEPVDIAKATKVKEKVNSLILESIKQIRNISHELTPLSLEKFGLKVAVENFCENISTPELTLECDISDFNFQIDKYLEIALFRISQELVNNIVKHSSASKAIIEMFLEKNHLILISKDNGKGFDTKKIPKKSIGLRTITERIVLLNGKVKIRSKPGEGTSIIIDIPFKNKNLNCDEG